ncbi:MAG: serine/threonine-protein kinase [Planctomycetota bacterium]
MAITMGPGQSFVAPSVDDLRGHLKDYDVQALIGQGGMGAVYLGRQKSLDRPVAIKILPPEVAERDGFRDRFAREGKALAKLNHPNIVSVIDFGQAGPYAMLVMELVEGANLREVLSQGRLTAKEALEILPQLCDALSYAHDEGVVHRDIKPENLLFDNRGRLKITDFGLAKLIASRTKEPGEETSQAEATHDPTRGIVGTLHYMAPEQLENPTSVDHRADIYALGVVFYEMLTGELPIGRFDPPSEIQSSPKESGLAKVLIDVRLDEVVMRALEKHPEKRYGSASAVMSDIDEIERTDADQTPYMGWHHDESFRKRVGLTWRTTKTFFRETLGWTIRHPKIEIPAYTALVVVIGSLLLAWMFVDDNSEESAMTSVIVGGMIAVLLSRLSLHRERVVDLDSPNLITRFILAVAYLAVALPLVIAPGVIAFAIWTEVNGFPRDPGESGWSVDWAQSLSGSVFVSSVFCLIYLVVHVAFPQILTTLFRPFIRGISGRSSLLVGAFLVGLAFVSGAVNQRSSYLDRLSPNEFRELERNMRR